VAWSAHGAGGEGGRLAPPGQAGDFLALLRASGRDWPPQVLGGGAAGASQLAAHATTVLALKHRDGIVVAGDRRATAGTTVVYDRADKVLQLDEFSVLGIAGVPAFASEIARILEHSFKYFRRSQLQELSVEGKLRSLSNLLRDQLPLLLQGVGLVAPLFACWERGQGGRLYFYDPLGARFEGASYAASGSGGTIIQSILLYRTRYEGRRLEELEQPAAIALALQLLEVAADTDAATGGVRSRGDIFPLVKCIGENGVQSVPEAQLRKLLLD